MVRCDSDRGHHPGVSLPASVSPVPGEYIQSSSESEAEQPSPTDPQEQPIPSQIPTQAVCVVKLRSRPCLRFNSARHCTRRVGQASPSAIIQCATTQHRPDCPRVPRGQASDSALVGELNQEASNALGPAARRSASPGEPQAQNASAKGGLQPRFFAPPPRWSQHLLGVAVPKPRPLTRPYHGASFIGPLPDISQIG